MHRKEYYYFFLSYFSYKRLCLVLCFSVSQDKSEYGKQWPSNLSQQSDVLGSKVYSLRTCFHTLYLQYGDMYCLNRTKNATT